MADSDEDLNSKEAKSLVKWLYPSVLVAVFLLTLHIIWPWGSPVFWWMILIIGVLFTSILIFLAMLLALMLPIIKEVEGLSEDEKEERTQELIQEKVLLNWFFNKLLKFSERPKYKSHDEGVGRIVTDPKGIYFYFQNDLDYHLVRWEEIRTIYHHSSRRYKYHHAHVLSLKENVAVIVESELDRKTTKKIFFQMKKDLVLGTGGEILQNRQYRGSFNIKYFTKVEEK